MKSWSCRCGAPAALLLVTGCTVGPNFKPVTVDSPAAWSSYGPRVSSQYSSAEPVSRWWDTFQDPILSALMTRLTKQNLDIQEAAARIEEARAERDVVRSDGLPHLSATSSYDRTRYSPVGNPLGLVVPRPGGKPEVDVFQNGFTASWELDLFGRVRRSVEAADAQEAASVEDRRAIAVSAEAELAQDYLSLRGTQAQLRIAEANVDLAAHDTDLVRDRLKHGAASSLDLAQAEAQQETTEEQVSPLQSRAVTFQDSIALLLGRAPGQTGMDLVTEASMPRVPELIEIGLPATLLRRRPDIRRAEARLQSATAQVGVAVANLYPDVALNGTFGLNSLQLKDAFNIYSRMFDVGPTVSLPIFQGGRLTSMIRLRKAQEQEAALEFKKTVLNALREVESTLATYYDAQVRLDHVRRAATFDQQALEAARARYTHGASSFLNVITAQAALLQEQSNLAGGETDVANDLVALYRTLGGGWETDGVAPTAPSKEPL